MTQVPAGEPDTGMRPEPRHLSTGTSRIGSYFRPRTWFDRVFEVAIIAKGVNGLGELIGGLLLIAATPDKIHHLVAAVTQGELSEDPHDVVARYLLHTSAGLTGNAVTFGAIYLLLHGAVKVVLVVSLLRNKLWAYPWMIIVLIGFISYQIYRIALSSGPGLIALTLFDIIIVVLTWREWRVQRGATPSRTHSTTVSGPAQVEKESPRDVAEGHPERARGAPSASVQPDQVES